MEKRAIPYYIGILTCLVLGSFLVYGNAIKGDFVYDDILVLTAPTLQQASSLPDLFIEPYHYQFPQSGIYRPLTSISFALNFIIFGQSPPSFHVVNILLHALVCFVIILLMRELLGSDPLSYAIGVLFLVLPIHTEAVTSIVGRGELLWVLFGMLVILSRKNVILSLFLFLCALLSKETAVSVIPLLGIVYLSFDRYSWQNAFKKIAWYIIPLGSYFAMRYAALGNDIFSNNADIVYNPLKFTGPLFSIIAALKILGLYLQKILVPYNLVSDYSYNQIPVSTHIGMWSIVGACTLVVMVAGCMMYRRYPRIAITSALFLFPYLVISNLIYKTGTIMAERLMYMSSLGVIILLVLAGDKMLKKSLIKKSVLIILVIGYAIVAIGRNRVWLTQEALSRDAYAKSPNSILTQLGMAQVEASHGNTKDAKALLLKANALYGKNVEALNLLGVIAWQEKQYAEAEQYFQNVLVLRPVYFDTLVNLSRVYYQEGKYAESAKVLSAMHEHYGAAMGVQNMRLYLWLENYLGNYDRVIELVNAMGYNEDIHFLIGYAYLKKGDATHAREFLGSYQGTTIAKHFQEIGNDFK